MLCLFISFRQGSSLLAFSSRVYKIQLIPVVMTTIYLCRPVPHSGMAEGGRVVAVAPPFPRSTGARKSTFVPQKCTFPCKNALNRKKVTFGGKSALLKCLPPFPNIAPPSLASLCLKWNLFYEHELIYYKTVFKLLGLFMS